MDTSIFRSTSTVVLGNKPHPQSNNKFMLHTYTHLSGTHTPHVLTRRINMDLQALFAFTDFSFIILTCTQNPAPSANNWGQGVLPRRRGKSQQSARNKHDTTKVFKSLQTRYLHTTPVEQRSLLVPINSAFVTSDQHSTIYVSSVLVADGVWSCYSWRVQCNHPHMQRQFIKGRSLLRCVSIGLTVGSSLKLNERL